VLQLNTLNQSSEIAESAQTNKNRLFNPKKLNPQYTYGMVCYPQNRNIIFKKSSCESLFSSFSDCSPSGNTS